jgi:hypothetical protein
MDDMFVMLDQSHVRLVPVFVWNLLQFPLISRETFGTMIRDRNSRSRHLLREYVGDFIQRYHGRHTILFYELTNELNLAADLDLGAMCLRDHPGVDREVCAAEDHFTSKEMTSFSQEMVAYITKLDPGRPVSSGYSTPRSSAWHLAAQPQFSKDGADWTEDSVAEWKEYLKQIHDPYGIISIHVYPDRQKPLSDPAQQRRYQMMADAASVARTTGKPLFVGEFGDGGVTPENNVTPFLRRITDSLNENKVQYAAFWEWEYSAKSLDQDFGTEPENIDPSTRPNFVDLLRRLAPTEQIPTSSPGSAPKPRVVMTWPLPCTTVDRPIAVSAVASVAAGPVDHVEFFLDGISIGTTSRPPYRVSFDPLQAGTRKAVIEARASSHDGVVSGYASPVRLNGDQQPCAVPPE